MESLHHIGVELLAEGRLENLLAVAQPPNLQSEVPQKVSAKLDA